MPPFYLVLFLEISLSPQFWLPLCVCFCVLGRSVVSPSLGRVALCSRCPMGHNRAVSLIMLVEWSRSVPCVAYVIPPIVVESWLLLAHIWVGLTLRMAGCEDWPQQYMSYYAGLTPRNGIFPRRIRCLLRPLFQCAACGANWVVLCCSFKQSFGCVCSGVSWGSPM